MTTRKKEQPEQDPNTGDSYALVNYRLHKQIGQEELATSYLASHITLDRPVQVHILRRTDWISVSRFQLAARLAARLSHPNLLPVIDAGHDETLGDYIVTPMLEGISLNKALTSGFLEPALTLRIATQMAAVLDYLHAQQIVHRDVQPSNIIITTEGITYLSNLSLAASPDTPDLSSVDEADYLTPYSAPEQRLDQSEATAALDIYSMGAVLYHMFSGDIPPAPGMDLPTLANRDTELAEADPVLQRMMATDPDMRFKTATDAINALRRALQAIIDRATEDMEESRWEPTAEWLENPLEIVLSDMLDQDYMSRSRARADSLHRSETITRLLNRWSRQGFFHRPALGHIIQIEHMVSYNIYFYELRTSYETRAPLSPRQRARKPEERVSPIPPLPLWEVSVPDSPPFDAVSPQDVSWPNSKRVLSCPECSGVGRTICKKCDGKGTIERTHKVRQPDNRTVKETLTENCPTCQGHRQQVCTVCEGSGQVIEEQWFKWSRHVYLWKNTDDLEGLPRLALRQRMEPVYEAPINPYEGRWHSVAPMAELLRVAISNAGEDTHILATELRIQGVPITEIDYRLSEDGPLQHMFIVGEDTRVVGPWSLLNPERLILVAVSIALVLVIGGSILAVVL